jgi:hypothetical protein
LVANALTKYPVPASKPEILLEKLSFPLPAYVLVFSTVGFNTVLQQTPFATIGFEPSSVIIPPLTAVEEVIPVTSTVDNTGTFSFLHP